MPATLQSVQLPTIILKGKEIDPAVLEIIPLQTAEKFQVIAYNQDEKHLSLAVVHPEQLKQGFFDALKQVGAKIGKEIELTKTDAASFHDLISQYRAHLKKIKKDVPDKKLADQSGKPVPFVQAAQPAPKPVEKADNHGWPEAPKPPLFELGKLVAYNYLRRIPPEFSEKERILSVDFLKPNTYWFVTDGTNDARLKKVAQYISENNHIVIHVLVIAPKDFDDLLRYYKVVAKQEQQNTQATTEEDDEQKRLREEEEIERKLKELSRPSTLEDEGPRKWAPDVIVPGIQAQIISKEEEKGGLAGFIQKITQNFAAQEAEKGLETATPFTPPPEVVAAKASLPPIAQKPTEPTAPVQRVAGLPSLTASDKAKEAAPVPPPAPQAKPAPAQPAATQSRNPLEDTDDIGKLLDKHVTSLDELKEIIRSGMVPRIVAAIVSFAIHEKASDIHVESYDDEVRVRYRVDGQLIDIVKLPPDIHNPMVSRIKILSKLRLDENRVPQDGRFDVNFDENVQVDVRISVMPTVHGEKVVMRILDKSRGITSLEKLGLEGIAYERLTQAIQKPYGICLSTGPTGSGKSTSLYAILSRIATPNVNVVTLEDPIEYEMKGVNQSQIRPKIGYTFAEGLRSILRQDPNIIMVGEIRDGETANMATQAALTGHLVLSTLHTNDAAGSIPRLTNMGIEPFLITSSLNVAMAQRLVRKICPNCRREISLPQGIRSQFEKDIEAIASLNPSDARRIKRPITFYQGSGCDQCGGKGYQGRVGIYEVLVMTEEIADLTVERADANKIAEAARKDGMLTLYQDGLLKAIAGITTIDEVLRESSNK
jgi:type II secretory ATPase GspE/PulE/Tfp pilus assembly ATPase PilB-like protein